MPNLTHDAEWQDAYSHLRESLGLTAEEPVPEMPRAPATASVTITEEPAVEEEPAPTKPAKGKKGKATNAKASKSKRKAPEKDDDVTMTAEAEDTGTDLAKKLKADGAPQANGAVVSPEEATLAHAKATAAYIPFLTAEYLLPPKMPSHEEMEQFLLDLRKKALVEEYFGDS